MDGKLWSHDAAQKATQGQLEGDEQEALSRRYGAGTIQILPLRSGRIAIFDSTHQLIQICEVAPTVEDLQGWSLQGEEKMRQIRHLISQKQQDGQRFMEQTRGKPNQGKDKVLTAEEMGL